MSARAAPFSRAGVLALLVVGMGVLFAILYFLASGEGGPQDGRGGGAHSAANGINGYSALVDLVEADGFDVRQSREQSGLETEDLLVLTPPHMMDPQELGEILANRRWRGPTLVILPKWNAVPANFLSRLETPEKAKEGWVLLSGTRPPRWANADNGPLALGIAPETFAIEAAALDTEEAEAEAVEDGLAPDIQLSPSDTDSTEPQSEAPPRRFETRGQIRGLAGELPTAQGFFAEPAYPHIPLVVDQDGRTIALAQRDDTTDYDAADPELRDEIELDEPNQIVFVIEPDLMNNWGMADPARAQTALSIIRIMGDGYVETVVFDLTLNGFGGAMNLLTLAFRPPFLAATICLLLAIVVIGWRAFARFGPAALRGRETAFGKARLVTNGADLIARAGRLQLLAEPYIALSARRVARALGLARADAAAIDAALAVRQPGEPSFTARAQALRAAARPTEILRAARALNTDLSTPQGT